MTLYNEIEPYAARWLRNLSDAGHIAEGTVDERSIADLRPADLAGHRQCHFFAGIGVWSHALRLAGVPDDFPVWTGSCPCQPFSDAGNGAGFDDPRHLWPTWFELIEQCRPPLVFGEQVASKDGLAWLDLVQSDLEGAGYAVGAFDLCAASFGAPHIRQRLYFVAYTDASGFGVEWRSRLPAFGDTSQRDDANRRRAAGGMADYACERWPEGRVSGDAGRHGTGSADGSGMGDTGGEGGGRDAGSVSRSEGESASERGGTRDLPNLSLSPGHDGRTRGFWDPADWIPCRDPQRGIVYRPVEPGTFPLAHGVAGRVGRLRAYGNAIVAPQAAEFIRAALEAITETAPR